MAIVSAPTRPKTRCTAARYLAMPDDGKLYEVLDGELIMVAAPNLRHQEIAGNIFMA